ncbi:MAG: MBL fold metallo-hydrolase [Asgard group archaeon]|nr:MBL fold metallo-hydrolase [Asgard group archaeon]
MSDKIIDIGKSVVMYEGQHNTNIICIELDEGLVFVDTGRQDDVAKDFRKKMEKRFNKKATHLLLTHYHIDHISGMSAFKDIEIIGSKTGNKKYLDDLKGTLTLENRKADVERWKKMAVEHNWEPNATRDIHWEYYPKVELFPTTKVVDEYEIGSGKQKVIFKRVGGHTECSAYIHLPHEDMILLGDNFVGDPSRVGGCFFGGLRKNSIKIYDEIIKLKPKIILPGHGPQIDLAYLEKAQEYFKKFFKVLDEMYDKGIDPSEAAKYKGLPEFYDEKPDYWDDRVVGRLYNVICAEKTIEKIDKQHKKLDKASIENDVDKLLKYYTKDFVITVSDGFFVQGEETFRRCFRPTKFLETGMKREDHYFTGDQFIEKVLIKSKTETNGKEETSAREAIHIWTKENGVWKIKTEVRLGDKDIS